MRFKRILLKLSGESMASEEDAPICDKIVNYFVEEIQKVLALEVQVAVVIGGGNIYRGKTAAGQGLNRINGDYMGMLATVINALAINEKLKSKGCQSVVMSSLPIDRVVEPLNLLQASKYLDENKVVLFAAGLGEPFFTTDSTAALRALQIHADVLLKGTRVDGVYNDDPEKNPSAEKFDIVTFEEVLKRNLKVMDSTAFTLCSDNKLPIVVFDMNKEDSLLNIIQGKHEGSLVTYH